MQVRFGNWKRMLAMAVALGLLVGLPALAQDPPAGGAPKIAILIVGDEGNAEMLREEKALITEMTRLLSSPDSDGDGAKFPNARTLQVYSYHFDKSREKVYCEKILNILREDLLFVGIVELKNNLPRRVLYRLDRITRANRAAADVLARAEEIFAPTEIADEAPSPEASPAASKSPQASASPSASKSPTPGASPSSASTWRIQVGSFAELVNAQDLVARLKEKGFASSIDHTTRNGANLYRVYVGSYPNRQEAQSALDRLKAEGFDKAFLAAPEEGSLERHLPARG